MIRQEVIIMEHNENFIEWLHDAYNREVKLIPLLEAHKEHAEAHKDVFKQIDKHLEETKNHAQVMKGILKEMGEDVSEINGTIQSAAGAISGQSTVLADDRLIKNAIADYSTEHLEIATYAALIKSAEVLGHKEIVARLKGILNDEIAMAKWLENNLPGAVETFLT